MGPALTMQDLSKRSRAYCGSLRSSGTGGISGAFSKLAFHTERAFLHMSIARSALLVLETLSKCEGCRWLNIWK